ncbi:MAG: 50S ribosomal protein L3 [Betaproteobacteria bacterium]|jgi:large subunit ribosomal protein L3|nr:MAG: 50S ribosomal protein L3 [Betaproteobacteria bacterium]TAG45514.1 MAG: 50S ribosomal protein L3 [Betaproteobacteria bacterium]
MSLGLIGRKVGMTRVFHDDGSATAVTVVDVANNRVSQIKTAENDGYAGVQVTYGERRAKRVTKAAAGHFAKAGVQAGSLVREWNTDAGDLKPGAVVSVETFKVGQLVDVTGTTKGRGFTGVIRRHHFSSNRETHGNSVTTRAPGSIGMAQDPGRVFPGKRMAGQHGNAQRTTQGLAIVRIDAARGLLLIKGAIPGSPGGHVIVKPTVRS